MGTIQHHSITVVSWDETLVIQARRRASNLSLCVTPIVKTHLNSYHSFAVLPDGSKEGWTESDLGDDARLAFMDWMDDQAYNDGSNALEYAEVSFGELPAAIITNQTPPEGTKQ